MTVTKSLVFFFDDIEVHERELSIVRGGEVLFVEPRVFQVLLCLLHNAQRLVTKEELLSTVWDDAVVTENSLARTIVRLRHALGDDAKAPRYVETVARVGYRFTRPVRTLEQWWPPSGNSDASGEPEKDKPAKPDEDATVSPSASKVIRPRILKWTSAGAAMLLILASGYLLRKWERGHWAQSVATPEIARLIDSGEYQKAAELALKAHAVLPGDPVIQGLWARATGPVSFSTDPPGAEVFYRPYHGDPNTWTRLGQTPIVRTRLPQDSYVFRVSAPGYVPYMFIGEAPRAPMVGDVTDFDIQLKLRHGPPVPPEMVLVPGDWATMTYPLIGAPAVQLDDFLIDRHEVTNEEFKRFVDAGGYSRREFWKQPFLNDGRAIPWDKAIDGFRDSTGRPGPATWEAGSFPTGKGNHPVAGVSWYEAAAYAEFAGKSLPTAYHWMLASQADWLTPLIAAGSNFRLEGTQPVGAAAALSGWGTTDMAGNVKEWCLNEHKDGKRFILGGGFGEPDYMFNFTDAQSPWDRRANFGFRCIKLLSAPNLAAQQLIDSSPRDFWHDKPVSDDVFKVFTGLYAYDKTPLNAHVEQAEPSEHARRERVSFDAAYNHERMTAYFFLPLRGSAPFQTVVYFPGAMATLTDSLDLSTVENAYDFILKSGRALVVPVYKGTYQRRDGYIPGRNTPVSLRDHIIAWSKDLSRTLDYMQTRADMDNTKLAYLGFSMGASQAPVMLAINKRFKAAILFSGGFQMRHDLPEVDPVNFDGRMTTPTLMLNGRYDTTFPEELSQRPLFQFMGTPPKDKKYVIYDGGHGAFPRPAAVRESLDWLDKYLGRPGG